MSPSPDAQMPSTYHVVSRAEPAACISIFTQVPAGVAAFHEAMSSSNANGAPTQSPIQLPLSYATATAL